ncbi:MAG TPA: hypothetical protein VJP02_18505 [Candidatus Sulfotelmatobacter sp.]|nr:hypothetical protein [Candidatus Sulfotelmatobacter sp.]
MTIRFLACLLAVMSVLTGVLLGDSSVPVRTKEGLTHGFLVLSTLDGKQIAVGDLTEVARGNKVTTRLIFHFGDGSLQDETTVFSQRRTFSLISYHLVQKGPSFPHPTEMSVEMASGQVTVRSTNDKGEEKTESERLKLPPVLANGLVLTVLKNLRPEDPIPQLAMVVAAPKPRVVKLSISAQGKDPFTLAGSRREALHYVIKIEIGGLAGLVAPLLGKQPPDAHVWIIGGEAPTFVKSEALSFLGGPVWRMELTSPIWPKSEEAEPRKGDSQKP